MAAIRLANVSKRYEDGTMAVSELDLEIRDGELMVLVGPSGSGKSTALRMIAGLEEITGGELAIGDEIVNDRAAKDRDIAMVFQNYALYPHMTVRENMGFALRMARTPRAEADRRIESAAALLDLTEQLERRPSRLSGGQRQRVAMGRAIVREPAAFLMDEPLSNLDAKLRVQMRTEIARIQQRLGTTTVYVTHDQVEAMTLGHRVAVMRAGRLEQVGTPQQLYERPANRFVAGFIGSPAMNFLPGRIEHDALRLPFGVVPLPVGLQADAGRDVLVGVRPEHFGHAADAPGLRFSAQIDVVESLGSEVHAHFPVAGDHHVCARLAGDSAVRPGVRAELVVDPSRLRVFDPVSERSLLDEAVAA